MSNHSVLDLLVQIREFLLDANKLGELSDEESEIIIRIDDEIETLNSVDESNESRCRDLLVTAFDTLMKTTVAEVVRNIIG